MAKNDTMVLASWGRNDWLTHKVYEGNASRHVPLMITARQAKTRTGKLTVDGETVDLVRDGRRAQTWTAREMLNEFCKVITRRTGFNPTAMNTSPDTRAATATYPGFDIKVEIGCRDGLAYIIRQHGEDAPEKAFAWDERPKFMAEVRGRLAAQA